PVAEPVEQSHSRRRWRQQRHVDPLFIEETEEACDVLQADRPMVAEREGAAIELGAAVDEGCKSRIDQVAAEIVIVEDFSGLALLDRLYRGGRSDATIRCQRAGGGERDRDCCQDSGEDAGGERG